MQSERRLSFTAVLFLEAFALDVTVITLHALSALFALFMSCAQGTAAVTALVSIIAVSTPASMTFFMIVPPLSADLFRLI